MYEQIGEEFVEGSSATSSRSLALNTIEEREFFVDSLLTNLLGDAKLREKDSLVNKLKHKRHQLEVNTKQIRREEKLKRELANGRTKTAKIKNKKRLVLNCKLKKSLRMYKLDKNAELDYSKYEKMNESWNMYAISCLMTHLPKNLDNQNQERSLLHEENVLNCLKQMDYHGACLTVTSSNSKYQIGISGIVLQDKKNVFFLLTKENKIKIIPKFGNLFEFDLLGCKLTLVGSNMCHRPEMRTTKHAKLKTKVDIK